MQTFFRHIYAQVYMHMYARVCSYTSVHAFACCKLCSGTTTERAIATTAKLSAVITETRMTCVCMYTWNTANSPVCKHFYINFPPPHRSFPWHLIHALTSFCVDLISPNLPPSRLTSYSSLPAVFPLKGREISGAKISRRLSGTSVGTLKL